MTSQPTGKRQIFFELLERRLLLSADILPLPTDDLTNQSIAENHDSQNQVENLMNSAPELSMPEDSGASDVPESDYEPLQDDEEVAGGKESKPDSLYAELSGDEPDSQSPEVILFVNDNIDDLDEFTGQLDAVAGQKYPSGAQLVILDSGQDGLSQVAQALQGHEDVREIHIFSHGAGEGNTAAVQVGSTWLNADNLEAHRQELESWGTALTPEGDILLYGCETAAGEAGERLISGIAEITGADVAASNDFTGHASLGGDWELEYAIGAVEADALNLNESWIGLLVEETIRDDFNTGTYSGSSGSLAWNSDWGEIGEVTDPASGAVQVVSGELRLLTADDNEQMRGLVRGADLSPAARVYLSYDYSAMKVDGDGWVEVQIRADGSGSWTTLKQYDINSSPSGSELIDVTAHKSVDTQLRIVTEGQVFGGNSYGNDYFYFDNVIFEYTTTSFDQAFWFTTKEDVANGGQPGFATWSEADLLAFGDPGLALEDGVDKNNVATDGVISLAASMDAFVGGRNIIALHYVGTDIQLGSSGFQLYQGDVLLSSNNADSFGGLAVTERDVVVFHPDTPGDYTSGTFTMLLHNIGSDKITAFTLVEQNTQVGSTDIEAGDFLFVDDDDVIRVFNTIDVGVTSTSGSVTVLLDGDAGNVNFRNIEALDLVESPLSYGGRNLSSGDLLIVFDGNGQVGNNNLSINQNDIISVSVSAGSGDAIASHFFQGSEVGFNTTDERFDGFSLVALNSNSPPSATNLSAAETYTEDTPLDLTDIVITEPNNNDVTMTLTLSDTLAGSLSTGTSGAVTSTFAAGVWTASGAVADVNTLLAGVVFTPAADYDQDFTITTSVSDGIAAPVTGVKSMTANPVNDAPTATNLSLAEVYTVNTSLNLADIVISDIDSSSVTATLTLSDVTAGSLSTGTSGAVTSTFAAGVWSASGALADVNTLLAGIVYTPNGGYSSAFTLATSVSDGVAPAIVGIKNMTSTGGNVAPTATNLDAAETYTEDTPLDLIDIDITDDSANVTAKLALSDPLAGSLSVASSGTVTSTYDSVNGVWSASGPLADVETLLWGVVFTPSLNYDSDFTMSTSVDDGVAAPVTGTKNFTAIPVDDDPTATNLSTPESYVEEVALDLTNIVVSDVDSSNITVTLSLSDAGAGTLSTGTSGSVTSTFAGGVWSASGALADVNTLLAGVIFTPTADYNSNFIINTSVTDLGPPLTGAKNMIATDVNDAPTAVNNSGGLVFTEDTVLDLPDIVVSDIDSPKVTVTLTLSTASAGSLNTGTSGGVTSTFSGGVWSANGLQADVNALLAGVAFTPSADFDSNFTISTTVDDGEAAPLLGSFTLSATPVGDTPAVTSVSTDPATQTGLIIISPNANDGSEVTHFQVTGITNGTLYQADGVTVISDNEFITVAQGAAGVRFTPAGAVSGSFLVSSSEDGTTVAAQSGTALSVITVIAPAPPAAEPPASPLPIPVPGNSVEEPFVPVPEEPVNPADLAAGILPVNIPPAIEPKVSPSSPDEFVDEDEGSAEESEEQQSLIGASVLRERSLSSDGLSQAIMTEADLNFDLMLKSGTERGLGLKELVQLENSLRSAIAEVVREELETEVNALMELLYSKRSMLETQLMNTTLDFLKDELQQEARLEKTIIGSAIAATTTLSAGYVIWLIRSGVLLSSLLSSMPAWQLADPLAILAGRKAQSADDSDDSLEGIIKSGKQDGDRIRNGAGDETVTTRSPES